MTETQEKIKASKPDLTHINSIADLRLEQKRVQMRIRIQEKQLKEHVKRLPGELVYTGIKTVVPTFLAGKLTNTALNGLRSGVNNLFDKGAKEKAEPSGIATVITSLLPTLFSGVIKQIGVGAALRLAFGLLNRNKHKDS